MRNWYTIKAKAKQEGDTVIDEVVVYDEIGFWGIEAKDFAEQIKGLTGDRIALSINSPGGDVFAAATMFNTLKATGKPIDVTVMGIAASAASYLAMAGDTITMPDNTMMMLHKPWTFAMGNGDELRETADVLDKIHLSLNSAYMKRSGMSQETYDEIMAKDTYLTAAECKELGLCDTVSEAVEARAHFDVKGLPPKVVKMFEEGRLKIQMKAEDQKQEDDPVDPTADPADPVDPAQEDQTPHQFAPTHVAMVRELVVASELGDEYVDVFAMDDKLTTRQEVIAAITEAREIKALCDVAKQPQLAVDHIRLRSGVKKVRDELRMVLTQQDEATHTSNLRSLNANQGKEVKPADLNPVDIYANRAKQQQGKRRA